MLKAHAERLLTDEAVEVIDVLLAEETGEEEGQQNQRKIKTLQQHRTILEKACKASIEAAYKQLIEGEHDPINILLQALLQVQTPAQLQQVSDQHPTLLEDETLQRLSEIASVTEQSGNVVAGRILRLCINELRRMSGTPEKRPDNSDTRSLSPLYDGQGPINVRDARHNLIIPNNPGTAIQNNLELNNYSLPPYKWQPTIWRGFDEGKDFVGRQKELDTLLTTLTAGENVTLTGRAISATLQGMAGIGKTYLAYKLLIDIPLRFSSHFPGGVILIEVGPQIINEQIAQLPLGKLANHAFGGSLLTLAVGQLDPDIVASWLSNAAPGRFLVIFDDVWDESAMRFLSRALPPMAVRLVTTRYASTANALGGYIVSLEVLSLDDGLALLKDRLHCQDDARYQNDMDYQAKLQAKLEEMVKVLEGHALALDIAAALIEQPIQERQIGQLLDDLRKDIGQGALSRLSMPERDRNGNLERSLEISYRRMDAQEQKRFRALGIFAPETPITAEAAAAIWGIEESAARMKLTYFKNLALLIRPGESGEDTYRQHSLLRAYALALLNSHNELTSASWSHANYYANLVRQAETAVPKNYPLLDQHLQNILAALKWSSDNEPSLFSRLLEVASQYLFLRGQFALLKAYLPQATNASATIGAKGRQANLLKSLGDLERHLSHLDEARSHYDAALPLYKAEQDQLGQANLLKSLGDLERHLGHLEEARSHYDAALPLYKAVQDQLGQANLLLRLGDLEYRLGHLEEARSHYDAALPLFKAVQSQLGQANLLKSLGDLERHLGHLEEARSHYDAALPLFKAVQSQLGQANVYMSIADMFLAQKDWELARNYYEQALPLFIVEQDPLGQANTLIDLGRVRFELGDHDQGIKDVQQAAVLYRSLQNDEWARRAELYLTQMRARLSQSHEEDNEPVSPEETEILQAFVNANSPQDILQLVRQQPQLLKDQWFAMIEALIAAQQDEGAKRHLSERFDTLKQIRDAGQQERVIVGDIAQALDEFARADWGKRRRVAG